MKQHNVKFVSYTGEYPNLCSGILTLEIDGELVNEFHLQSGGGLDDDFNAYEGEWEILIPPRFAHLYEDIVKIVNDNVDHGCCGGCI